MTESPISLMCAACIHKEVPSIATSSLIHHCPRILFEAAVQLDGKQLVCTMAQDCTKT